MVCMKNYYATLGLTDKATDDQIKQAYRTLAKRFHPDLHPGDLDAAKRFAVINEAMEIIGDPVKRREYDNRRIAEQRAAEQAAQAQARAQAAAAQARAQAAAAQARAQAAAAMRSSSGTYMGTASGAAAVINDTYRKGYNEGYAAAQATLAQSRNATAESWKKSAENWQKEAENRKLEIENLRRELQKERQRTAEAEEALYTQLSEAEEARQNSAVELAAEADARRDLKETLEDRIHELENKVRDYEERITVEREARRFADADKVRLSREVVRLKEENTELQNRLDEWEAYGASEEEDEQLQAISDDWKNKVRQIKKGFKNTYYDALGIMFWADDEAIQDAYLKQVKKLSGKEDAEQKLQYLREAFKVLMNADARRQYNAALGITEAEIDALRYQQKGYEQAQERMNEKAEEDNVSSYISDLITKSNAGDGEAAYALGELYLSGEGVKKDPETAVKWFTVGMEHGSLDAQYNLGLCFLNGEGAVTDLSRGVSLIKDAADKGNKQALRFIKDAGN